MLNPYLCRQELLPDRHELSGRYWEPQPDPEDLEAMEAAARARGDEDDLLDELPFM